jgi:hypothetical protein
MEMKNNCHTWKKIVIQMIDIKEIATLKVAELKEKLEVCDKGLRIS